MIRGYFRILWQRRPRSFIRRRNILIRVWSTYWLHSAELPPGLVSKARYHTRIDNCHVYIYLGLRSWLVTTRTPQSDWDSLAACWASSDRPEGRPGEGVTSICHPDMRLGIVLRKGTIKHTKIFRDQRRFSPRLRNKYFLSSLCVCWKIKRIFLL